MSCRVCGKPSKGRCEFCNKASYCSEECLLDDWDSGHGNTCIGVQIDTPKDYQAVGGFPTLPDPELALTDEPAPPPPPPPPPLPGLTTAPAKAHEPQILRMIRELRETIVKLQKKARAPREEEPEVTVDWPPALGKLTPPQQVSLKHLLNNRIAVQAHRRLRKAQRDLRRAIPIFERFDIANVRDGSELGARIAAAIVQLEIELKSLPPKLAELIYLHTPEAEPLFPLRRFSVASSYMRYADRRNNLLAALETTKNLTADTPQDLWKQLESRMFTEKLGLVAQIERFLDLSVDLKFEQDDYEPGLSEQEQNLAILAEFRGVKLELVRSNVVTHQVPYQHALVALGVSNTELQEDFFRHIVIAANQILKQALVAYLNKSSDILSDMWRYYEDLRAKNSPRQLGILTDTSNTVLTFYRRVLGYRRGKAAFFGPRGLSFRDERPLQKLLIESDLIAGLQDVINEITSELNQRLHELDVSLLKVSEELFTYLGVDFFSEECAAVHSEMGRYNYSDN